MKPACALDPAEDALFARYTAAPLSKTDIQSGYKMVVNSFPKSGSVWLVAMLNHLFGQSQANNLQILHVGDLRDARQEGPVFAVVALVRDLRDVVLSWHHETLRNDVRAGFSEPRYPTVEQFYFEHLIGFIQSEKRFEHGRLTEWLDFVTGRGFPLIRYEDMHHDPSSALRKIMNFWKVTVSDEDILQTVDALRFDRMGEVAEGMGGLIGETVANGHLHRGEVGRWRAELPERVLADIAQRFGEFQARLGYSKAK